MMKIVYIRLVGVIVIFLCSLSAYTQESNMSVCEKYNIDKQTKAMAKTTIATPEEDFYDVKKVHFDLSLSNLDVSLTGSVTNTIQTTIDNFDTYAFELNPDLIIDSIIINGSNTPFFRSEEVIKATLLNSVANNTRLICKIYYHGTPEAGNVQFFQSGINNAANDVTGGPVTFTLSEPYMSKDWWPCKQSLKDKIDTTIIWLTVPDSLMAGSNGVLQNVTKLPGGLSRYEWQSNYPVTYYLISLSIGNYMDYSFTMLFDDGTSMPVQNFIYNDSAYYYKEKRNIDSTAVMLQLFSSQFGKYPFWEEKYGHCLAPLFGGMEHQTMTTQRNFGRPLTAHELAHQWFGDKVTCATWSDIWLNEGFASYAEYLFAEKFWDENASVAYLQSKHDRVTRDTVKTGSVYVPPPDTVNVYRIFDGRLSYNKAASVLHTLRFIINDDDVFFSLLREYLKRFAFSNATTQEFKLLAEEISGMDLDTFFTEWIYGEGYPLFEVRWNQSGDEVVVAAEQTTVVPSSVPLYHIPVNIGVHTQTGWQVFRVDMNNASKVYRLNVSEQVDSLVFDYGNYILNEQQVIKDFSLGGYTVDEITVSPNPAVDMWTIRGLLSGQKLIMTDMQGKVLFKQDVTTNGADISAGGYARGIYFLQVFSDDERLKSLKLLKL